MAAFTLINVGTAASGVAVVTMGFTANVANVSKSTSGSVSSSIVGDCSWDFAISDTDCTTLGPHATCSVSVVCNPGMKASSAPESGHSLGRRRQHVPGGSAVRHDFLRDAGAFADLVVSTVLGPSKRHLHTAYPQSKLDSKTVPASTALRTNVL